MPLCVKQHQACRADQPAIEHPTRPQFLQPIIHQATLRYSFGVNTGSVEMDAGADWERFSATFTATGSGKVAISLDGPGTVLIDAVQVEKNGGTSAYNHVENSFFSAGTERWAVDFPAGASGVVTRDDRLASNVLGIPGEPGIEKRVYQEIPMNAKKGEMILFGAKAAAKATQDKLRGNSISDELRPFDVVVEFFREGQTTSFKTETVEFNRDIKGKAKIADGLQTVAGTYALAQDCSKVRLSLRYNSQVNTAYFYDVFLFVGESGTNYDYNGNGRLTKATTVQGTANYTYVGPNVEKIVVDNKDGSGSTTSYTYEPGTNNVKTATYKAKSKQGVENTISTTSYQYGTGGVLLESTVTADGASSTQKYEYTNDNNDVAKVTDGSGIYGIYQYASKNHNIITKSTASDGSVYDYGYESYLDYLTSVRSGGGQNSYNYGDDRLNSIVHNGTTYSFERNKLGQTTKISIGDQALVTKTYNSTTQRLQSTSYGNGHSSQPTYNTLGQVTAERFTSGGRVGITHNYVYANDGTLTRAGSTETGRSTEFGHDISGRLTDIYSFKTADKTDPTRIRMKYDDVGALAQFKASDGNGVLSQTNYTYDDRDRPEQTALTSLGGGTVRYAYTGMNRLQSTTHALPSGQNVTTGFAYWQNGSNATSFVTSMTNSIGATYAYTYKPGSSSIATVTENGALQHTYTYDSLGQLTKDAAPGKTTRAATSNPSRKTAQRRTASPMPMPNGKTS